MNTYSKAFPYTLSIGLIFFVVSMYLLTTSVTITGLTQKNPKTNKNDLSSTTISSIVFGSLAIILLIVSLILYNKKS